MAFRGNFQRAHQVQATVHQLFRGLAALGPEAGDHRLDAGPAGVPYVIGGEIDAAHQGAAVNPLGTGVPAFHAGRVQQVLTHIARLPGQVADAGSGELGAAHQSQRTHNHFSGALQASEPGLLEEFGVKQHPEHRANVVIRFDKSIGQKINGGLIAGRGYRPSRDLSLVGDEEIVEVAGDELGSCRLAANDVDDVFAVKCAGFAQESLFSVVVVLILIFKEPVSPADGAARKLGADGPTGESPGTLPNVNLGIVANAHAEQLQQLTTPIFVDGIGRVFAVVQPVNHRRVFGQLQQQLLVVAHALVPEQHDHVVDFVVVVHLGHARGEHLVPEQGHFFGQGLTGVQHGPHPFGGSHALDRPRTPGPRMVAHHFRPVLLCGGPGIKQLVDRGLVSIGSPGFQFFPGSAKPGPPHQVSRQGNFFTSHSVYTSHFDSKPKSNVMITLTIGTRQWRVGQAAGPFRAPSLPVTRAENSLFPTQRRRDIPAQPSPTRPLRRAFSSSSTPTPVFPAAAGIQSPFDAPT